MKFGRNLPRNQVPEWSASYINYKSLKKLINAAVVTSQSGETADLAEFFFALDRNLERVDGFYNKKFAETYRRLKLLQDRYGRTPDVVHTLDQDEVEELIGALLELRSMFRKLQWFGEINRRGFVKITKKLDKKMPDTAIQHRYIATKVDPKPFARDAPIVRLLGEINKWLSLAGESQNTDDSKSDRSSLSLGRVSAKAMLSIPQAVLDALDQAIKSDDSSALEAKLKQGSLLSADLPSQAMMLNLLQRSISARSRRCISFLLDHLSTLDEPDDINSRNCIHRLVIHIGRSKNPNSGEEPNNPLSSSQYSPYVAANSSPGIFRVNGTTPKTILTKDDEAIQILIYLLDSLKPHQRPSLSSKDSQSRLPLHYAAQFGFVAVCEVLIAKMQEWGQYSVDNGIDSPEWHDHDGHAPLHLAVLGGHHLCTQALLSSGVTQYSSTPIKQGVSESSHVLAIATKAGSTEIVRLLVNAGVDVNWQDSTGDSALHFAARFGHAECARTLLEGGANLELTENSFSWTPLHTAAADGNMKLVKLLVDAGANITRLDSSGWNAKEHAALRGHLRIAKFLADQVPEEESEGLPRVGSSLEERRSKGGTSQPQAEPIKSFGHRYLRNESLVLVSLGTMDMRRDVDAVSLDRIPLTNVHSTQLDTALSIVVSASGAAGEPATIDLPANENIYAEPVVFTTSDPAGVRLMFDIVPTYAVGDAAKHKVARAVALLSSVKPPLGGGDTKRSSLVGDVVVPLVSANTLEVLGTVHFSFLVITPFSHPNMEITSRTTYWKKSITGGPMVIGHRGLGKNMAANKSLQLGENTVQSFIAAANLGANYVEFDVQLTKDHVPVIYHDFLVSETGIDAPVHTLTLEQFLHINPEHNHRDQTASDNMGMSGSSLHSRAQKLRRTNSPGPRIRSMSQGFPGTGSTPSAAEERMKHTRDFKAKGFKANSRGNFIQAPFATLEQLFDKVPKETGFNIEMKYPMLHESQSHDMDAYAVELNSFVDTVLQVVYDKLGQETAEGEEGRHIIFSSFNPDVCLCLSFKQPSIPILFLSDATSDDAKEKISDVRASSLQEAIRFAARWNLLGIVSHAEVFCLAPRLVRVVKGMGLVCVSYGVLNNDNTMVQRQVKEGIDAVIVDSVLEIRKGLTLANGTEVQTAVGVSEGEKEELVERVKEEAIAEV